MLVLSRKVGEKLHVGDNVVIEIRRVVGRRVTIAIDAPRELRILRGEIMEAATAFDEPGESTGKDPAPAPLLAAPLSPAPAPVSAASTEPVPGAVQTEPYLVSHPPVSPPGIVPRW